jgi:hypothetical protein
MDRSGVMLRLLAVDTLGGTVRHASVEEPPRRPIRIGSSDACAMRLDGLLPIAAEIDHAGAWHVRFPATPRFPVADGAVFQLGAWTIALFVDDPETAPAVARLASERLARAIPVVDALASPHLVVDGRVVPVDTPRPVLVGSQPPIAAVARSIGGCVYLYPLAGGQVAVDGRLVTARSRLRDGARILVGGEAIAFVDPAEEVSRALGEEEEERVPDRPALTARLRCHAGRLPWLEVALVGTAVLIAAGFAALYVSRY